MSDSFRTDTRSFYWCRVVNVLTKHRRYCRRSVSTLLLPLLFAIALIPAQTLAQNHETPPQQAYLFDGLEAFDFTALLGAILPSEVIPAEGLEKNALATALFDLLKYMRNNVDPRTANEILAQIPRYKRVEMFGAWVNENSPENCYNTRGEVLLRDAVPGSKISFAPANPCQVAKGEWHDPYSDTTYKLSSAVQIDHVVPLKNAYRSGAYSWSQERRCHYSNFLADDQHLLAVSGRENMVKSDRGPDEYLPPNLNYTCAYVANWMRIKAVWNLSYTADEQRGIEEVLHARNCSVGSTRLSLKELQKDRALTLRMNVKCATSNPITP